MPHDNYDKAEVISNKDIGDPAGKYNQDKDDYGILRRLNNLEVRISRLEEQLVGKPEEAE
jgi:hypothetical protein